VFWWGAMPVNKIALEEGAFIIVTQKMTADGLLVYNDIVNLSVSYEEEYR